MFLTSSQLLYSNSKPKSMRPPLTKRIPAVEDAGPRMLHLLRGCGCSRSCCFQQRRSLSLSSSSVVVPYDRNEGRRQRQRSLCYSRSAFVANAVKELPWCAPKESPNRSKRLGVAATDDDEGNRPIDKFGIVAAASARGNVIGVGGSLPWNLPDDRRNFKNLTRNKVLVIGRNTLNELGDSNRAHVDHVDRVVVVSTTVAVDSICNNENDKDFISIARSFPEALALSRKLVDEKRRATSGSSEAIGEKDYDGYGDDIQCWIGGGERLYEEALVHPSASRLHLTSVDVEIDEALLLEKEGADVARFPDDKSWSHLYRLVEERNRVDKSTGIAFRERVFERR